MTTVGPGEAGVGTTHGCSTTGVGAGTALIGVGAGTILILPGAGAGTTHGDITVGAGEALDGGIPGVAGATPDIMAGEASMDGTGPTTMAITVETMPT